MCTILLPSRSSILISEVSLKEERFVAVCGKRGAREMDSAVDRVDECFDLGGATVERGGRFEFRATFRVRSG